MQYTPKSAKHFISSDMDSKSKIYSISDECFKDLFNTSNSFNEILKKLNMSHGRTSQKLIKQRCDELKLDTSKFSKNGGGKITRMSNEEIFVKNSTYKSSSHLSARIRRERLIKYQCAICGNAGMWENKPLTLQIDHINGDPSDNRINNLRFLCPNCHTQTETYGSKCRAK